ncbi:MAG: DotA/TraY family protein, partial [Synergistaceae bacterium]|nr:DotA/TraY family protein [Synergistaceae bacterium]
HTFGAVHIAHTGKLEDNQMFSSLWSPVRSVVALGLCSPVANGVSLMQHLILVAIAMSINFADNVSHSFVTYLAQDSSVKGFALSTPAIRQSGNDFVPIFTSVVTASVIQSSWLNMEGSEANPNKLEGNDISVEIRQVDEPATTLLGVKKQSVVEYAALIKFGGPSPQKVMPTIKVTAKNSKLAEAYGRAIQNMFTTVRKFTDEYFSTKIEDRRQNEVQIPDMIKQCRKQFDSDINTAQKALADVSEGAEKAMRLVSRMYTNTEMYGWVTVGLYPFIVAKAQSDWQSAFSVSVSTSSISWNEVSEYTTLSNQETQIVEKFFAEISKSEKESSAFSSVTAFLDTPVPSGEDILPPILRIFMDNFGVTPATLAKEFEEKNAVAVMNSKGVQCMTAAAAAMSQFGVISEKAKDKGIEGLLQGYGLNAGKMDSSFLKSLNGAVGIWSPVILVALSVVLLFGFSCAYVIPAIPIVFWGRALSSWAVLLVQTMMGAPFWAAAHVLPEGQGLAGQHARQGYLMLLDVFIRPTLLTCGAIMSMLLMEAWTKVLAK